MEQMGALLPLILIFGVFYILLIRPQQKKLKQHRNMIDELKRGDKIVTSGGIIGTINKVSDNKEISLDINDGIEIRIAPGMVTSLYSSPKAEKKEASKINESKENKNLFSGIFKKKDK